MHAPSSPVTVSISAMHTDSLQALPVSIARPSAQTDRTVTASTLVDKQQASAEEKQRGQLGTEDEYADSTTEDDNQVPQRPCKRHICPDTPSISPGLVIQALATRL